MAQTRYFDYYSAIKSKNSGEPIALTSGIGPKLGFDNVSVDFTNKKLTFDSTNGTSDNTKCIKLTDTSNSSETIKHIVITPDGIMTLETETIDVSFTIPSGYIDPTSGNSKELYIFLTASHTYTPDKNVTAPSTIYSTITINSDATILTSLGLDGGTTYSGKSMQSWFGLSSLSSLDSKSIIVGLYILRISNTNGTISYSIDSQYIPYSYTWPIPVKISQLELDYKLEYLTDRVSELQTLTSKLESYNNTSYPVSIIDSGYFDVTIDEITITSTLLNPSPNNTHSNPVYLMGTTEATLAVIPTAKDKHIIFTLNKVYGNNDGIGYFTKGVMIKPIGYYPASQQDEADTKTYYNYTVIFAIYYLPNVKEATADQYPITIPQFSIRQNFIVVNSNNMVMATS